LNQLTDYSLQLGGTTTHMEAHHNHWLAVVTTAFRSQQGSCYTVVGQLQCQQHAMLSKPCAEHQPLMITTPQYR
jgi:hypothetical protein